MEGVNIKAPRTRVVFCQCPPDAEQLPLPGAPAEPRAGWGWGGCWAQGRWAGVGGAARASPLRAAWAPHRPGLPAARLWSLLGERNGKQAQRHGHPRWPGCCPPRALAGGPVAHFSAPEYLLWEVGARQAAKDPSCTLPGLLPLPGPQTQGMAGTNCQPLPVCMTLTSFSMWSCPRVPWEDMVPARCRRRIPWELTFKAKEGHSPGASHGDCKDRPIWKGTVARAPCAYVVLSYKFPRKARNSHFCTKSFECLHIGNKFQVF